MGCTKPTLFLYDTELFFVCFRNFFRYVVFYDFCRNFFRHVIFRPAIDSELESAGASHESMLGKVLCNWKKTGEAITVNLEVPFGAHGTLYLPERFAGKVRVGETVLPSKIENGKAVFEFVSGKYTVEA